MENTSNAFSKSIINATTFSYSVHFYSDQILWLFHSKKTCRS